MKPWPGMNTPSDGSDPGSGPGPGAPEGTPPASRPGTGTRLPAIAAALAALAGLALAGWMIAAYLHRPRENAFDASRPAAVPSSGGAADPAALAADRYNAVLQVRVQGPGGEMSPVGTTLARKLTLALHDAEGHVYAEVFDRVGLWAIEVPPGAYVIPFEQPDLTNWKWTLAGDGITRVAGKGYAVTFAAGRMNPTIDLLLR